MLKPLLLSASIAVFMLPSANAMPGTLGVSGTGMEPAVALPIIKAGKKLNKLKNFGRKLNPLKKSNPTNPSANIPSNVAPNSVNAPSGQLAPSAPGGANAFPAQNRNAAPSWMSPNVKGQATETRTPAAKNSIMRELNERTPGRGMVYTENGRFRTKNSGALVTFKNDGTYSIDRSNLRNNWTPSEQRQISAINRGDVSFQFRNTDNGVLRMVDREGQEVFMNYTGQFTRKNTAIRSVSPLPPRTPPGSPGGSLRGQNQFQNT
ncbi:MAG: hypothetical protein ABJ349_04655, partial [Hyphomicrobiales bacterium]